MKTKLSVRQFAIIVLTLATAGIHFSLLFPDWLFILNGLGYLALLGAYFLPIPYLQEHRKFLRWIFIGFVLVTILGWVAIGDKSWPEGALGYIDKAVEVVLLILLWLDRHE